MFPWRSRIEWKFKNKHISPLFTRILFSIPFLGKSWDNHVFILCQFYMILVKMLSCTFWCTLAVLLVYFIYMNIFLTIAAHRRTQAFVTLKSLICIKVTFSFFGIAHVTNQTNPGISSTLPAVNINYLCALFVFTRLLLDEIYHFIELPFDWLIDWWCNVCFFSW